MNTYYGEAGNKKSPIYMLEVAGGITAAGRSNIKLAYDFVQSKNCKVYYGDTDSLYMATPEQDFA